MTDLSIAAKLVPYKPKHKVRFVTATSLFDGHDASINIMRRILQATGVEVIHLDGDAAFGYARLPQCLGDALRQLGMGRKGKQAAEQLG